MDSNSDSGSELNVAVGAMVVAVIAFIVACAQFLQQIFGTADGYRRCQDSVIGEWHSLVRLKWKTSEFRFETLFVTPHFVIEKLSNEDADIQANTKRSKRGVEPEVIFISGSNRSKEWTMSPRSKPGAQQTKASAKYTDPNHNEDQVSWSPLLQEIHGLQSIQFMTTDEIRKWEDGIKPHTDYRYDSHLPTDIAKPAELVRRAIDTEAIAIRLRQRSWDFVPPDVVRPLATTSVGFIVVLAHRLGMGWKDLRPTEGRMRAEGTGQSFFSTEIRGLGIVLKYSSEVALRPNRTYKVLETLHIPSRDADKLGCGILPGSKAMRLWDINLTGTKTNIKDNIGTLSNMFKGLEIHWEAIQYIRESVDKEDNRLPGFADLFGFWSDWLPRDGSPIVSVIAPFKESCVPITETPQAAGEWRNLLAGKAKDDKIEGQGPITPQQQKILRHLDDWARNYKDHFYRRNHLGGNKTKNVDYVRYLKGIFDETTDYFIKKNRETVGENTERPSRWLYSQLIASHISVMVPALCKAAARARENEDPDVHGETMRRTNSERVNERAYLYVKNAEKIVDDMIKRTFFNIERHELEDAYWMLLLRGLVWSHSIYRIDLGDAETIPSLFYDSTTPVYII